MDFNKTIDNLFEGVNTNKTKTDKTFIEHLTDLLLKYPTTPADDLILAMRMIKDTYHNRNRINTINVKRNLEVGTRVSWIGKGAQRGIKVKKTGRIIQIKRTKAIVQVDNIGYDRYDQWDVPMNMLTIIE